MKQFKLTLFLLMISSLLLAFAPREHQNNAPRHFNLGEKKAASLFAPYALSDGRLFVAIELKEKPTAQIFIDEKAKVDEKAAMKAAKEALATVNAEQERFIAKLPKIGLADLPIVFRMQRLFNGVIVKTNLEVLSELRSALEGHVEAFHPVPIHKPVNGYGVPSVEANALWSGLGTDILGDGVRVGVIDSGIDYLHADFGGPGSDADYEANDPSIITDEGFPNAKVVGGYDFAGEEYNPEESSNDTPEPDPDPMDTYIGHGTHVAGTLGGLGVNPDGSTFSGNYNQSLDTTTFKIAPGVAPKASLYALKVFGTGSTAIASQGVEWAIDPDQNGDFSDRLDVINLSLGGSYGNGSDFEAAVYKRAVEAGMIVVAAAGNEGDSNFINGAPSTVPEVIAVAASYHDGMKFMALGILAPESIAGNYSAAPAGFGPDFTEEGIQGMLVYAEPALACSAIRNADEMEGKVALIDRGDCYFVDKIKNAQNAGAIGVVMVNNVEGWAIQMGGSSQGINVPSLMISRTDGQRIKEVMANEPVTAWLTSTLEIRRAELKDTMAQFSSRGPSHIGGEIVLKPDVTAPGVAVMSAQTGSGTGGYAAGGTSMASPHAAGVMTLLRQLHPDWTPAELKALAMNTASGQPFLSTDSPDVLYSVARVGAGRLDAFSASQTEVIAYESNHPERVSLAFVATEVLQTLQEQRTIVLKNKGETDATYNVAYLSKVDMPGVEIEIEEESITVSAMSETTITVTLTADASLMQRTHDPTYVESFEEEFNNWLSEESGAIVFTAENENDAVLRVPLYATLRPVSDLHAKNEKFSFPADGQTPGIIELEGEALVGEEMADEQYQSLTTPMELKILSPNERVGGLPSGYDGTMLDSMDVRFVGVTSNATTLAEDETLADATIYFGVVTYGVWGTPMETQFAIAIDTDEDGSPDYAVVNFPWALDIFAAFSINARTQQYLNAMYLNGLSPEEGFIPAYLTDQMMLPVNAADIGLSGENSDFDFWVESMVDITDSASYDILAPCLDFEKTEENRPTLKVEDGTSIEAHVDIPKCSQHMTDYVLLMHHHNKKGARAETLYFEMTSPCETDEDCVNTLRPYCEVLSGACVECLEDAHCPEDMVCESRYTGLCMEAPPVDGDEDDPIEDGDEEDEMPIEDGDEEAEMDVVQEETQNNPPECLVGQLECRGRLLMACDNAGWFVHKHCPAECVDGECVGDEVVVEADGDSGYRPNVTGGVIRDDNGGYGCRQTSSLPNGALLLLLGLTLGFAIVRRLHSP